MQSLRGLTLAGALGKLSVNRPHVSLYRHMGWGINRDKAEIRLQVTFHPFKFGSGLLPDAVMVLIGILPVDFADTGSLVLLGEHLGKVIAQISGGGCIRRDFADGTFKRAAMLVKFVCR